MDCIFNIGFINEKSLFHIHAHVCTKTGTNVLIFEAFVCLANILKVNFFFEALLIHPLYFFAHTHLYNLNV